MNKIIEIHDDWYDDKMFDYIEDFILENKGLEYVYVKDITSDGKDLRPGFNCRIIPEKKNSQAEVTTSQILKRFCEYKNLQLSEIIMSRSFLQLPNGFKSRKNGIHIDLSYPHFVLLYYVNDSDGDTFLFDTDKKTVLSRITPKKGRVVFFDGSIYHCSSSPAKSPRAIINFCFNYKNINE